eukprot:COSAG02_NODE_2177_length_9589_cov_2.871760_3_plen_191_part_00
MDGAPSGLNSTGSIRVVHWQRCLHWMWILCFASPCLAWVIVQFVTNGGIYWKKYRWRQYTYGKLRPNQQSRDLQYRRTLLLCACRRGAERRQQQQQQQQRHSSSRLGHGGAAIPVHNTNHPEFPTSRLFRSLKERGGGPGRNGARARVACPRTFAIWRRAAPPIQCMACIMHANTHSIEGDARETAQCPD